MIMCIYKNIQYVGMIVCIVHVYMYIYMFLCVCMYLYICEFLYMETLQTLQCHSPALGRRLSFVIGKYYAVVTVALTLIMGITHTLAHTHRLRREG